MVAYFRQFLVMLLVLLQLAAPLVHAHVDSLGTGRGLHLHEFESLHVKSDSLISHVTGVADVVQSMVVELGAAINVPQSTEDVSPVYFLHSDFMLSPVMFIVETVNFSPHALLMVSGPFLDQNLTRAPPVPF